MKLLLDEMWSFNLAAELRKRGHDAVAVVERSDLRTRSDAVIFQVAQKEERAIVTENARDFVVLARARLACGGTHFGLILTINNQFPRGVARATGHLISALEDLSLGDTPTYNREIWLK